MKKYAKVIMGRVVEIVSENDNIKLLEKNKKNWESFIQITEINFPNLNKDCKKCQKILGTGYFYNKKLNLFYPQPPFPSWIFDEETFLWHAPVPYPKDGKLYRWSEKEKNWTTRKE